MDTLSRGQCDSIHEYRLNDVPRSLNGSSQSLGVNSFNGDTPIPCDYFDGVYEYIQQMLMDEDDLENLPCMFQDCSALQAAEKYFYDALCENDSSSVDSNGPPPYAAEPTFLGNLDNESTRNHLVDSISTANGVTVHSNPAQWTSLVDPQISNPGLHMGGRSSFNELDGLVNSLASPFEVLKSSPTYRIQDNFQSREGGLTVSNSLQTSSLFNRNLKPKENDLRVLAGKESSSQKNLPSDDPKRRSTHYHENDDPEKRRRNKQLASSAEDTETMEKYDTALLCPNMNPGFYNQSSSCQYEESSENEWENKQQYRKSTGLKRGRPRGGKKQPTIQEVVDLRSLLPRCAQAVANGNMTMGHDILQLIRRHSSHHGDATERLAHCFANALEARIAGTGSAMYTALSSRRISAAELLKAYHTYVVACPFKRMSNIFANKSIAKLTKDISRLHIIDFGILYGFQWPCIIQGLSLRPGGPPHLRITGIDFPQPGFRPAERVEQTGRRLMSYCKRFNVPFEYTAIAKRWDTITQEDLKTEREELLVVNCLYRLRHVADESAGVNSPRDALLSLIHKLNPQLFVHGIVNGTFNASFFTTRLREALYHYSSLFDMLEATVPREDQDRLLYEREVFGRDVMNAIACEGPERVERPETYKQWQVRNQRAGFRQIPLDHEIMREVKAKVQRGYHNDFLTEEDSNWMLQGWKGRVMYALSCWTPVQE